MLDLIRKSLKRKRKNKRKKRNDIFKLPYIERDYISTETKTFDHPITDEFILAAIRESLKPPILPEQKVFNSVEEMVDSIGAEHGYLSR